ncbi:MAG: cbb3-type cytochrome oxidase assembly protein CcoS [Acidiferrobacterales bacterium]
MEIIYLLIPIALFLAVLVAAVFFWSIRSGQFDDLEGPAHRILMDDDQPRTEQKKPGSDDNEIGPD